MSGNARRSFATNAAQEVIQFGGQRLVGRNEQLFDAAFQAVIHPFRNVFRIDIGHAPLRVDVNALVDEIHINIVGVGGNRQRTDTGLRNAAGRNVGGGAVFKFEQGGNVVFAHRAFLGFDRGSLNVDFTSD